MDERRCSGLALRLGRKVADYAVDGHEDVVGHLPDRILVREQAGVPLGLAAAELDPAQPLAGELCPGKSEDVIRALVESYDCRQVVLVAQRPAILKQDFVDGVVVGLVEPAD